MTELKLATALLCMCVIALQAVVVVAAKRSATAPKYDDMPGIIYGFASVLCISCAVAVGAFIAVLVSQG